MRTHLAGILLVFCCALYGEACRADEQPASREEQPIQFVGQGCGADRKIGRRELSQASQCAVGTREDWLARLWPVASCRRSSQHSNCQRGSVLSSEPECCLVAGNGLGGCAQVVDGLQRAELGRARYTFAELVGTGNRRCLARLVPFDAF